MELAATQWLVSSAGKPVAPGKQPNVVAHDRGLFGALVRQRAQGSDTGTIEGSARDPQPATPRVQATGFAGMRDAASVAEKGESASVARAALAGGEEIRPAEAAQGKAADNVVGSSAATAVAVVHEAHSATTGAYAVSQGVGIPEGLTSATAVRFRAMQGTTENPELRAEAGAGNGAAAGVRDAGKTKPATEIEDDPVNARDADAEGTAERPEFTRPGVGDLAMSSSPAHREPTVQTPAVRANPLVQTGIRRAGALPEEAEKIAAGRPTVFSGTGASRTTNRLGLTRRTVLATHPRHTVAPSEAEATSELGSGASLAANSVKDASPPSETAVSGWRASKANLQSNLFVAAHPAGRISTVATNQPIAGNTAGTETREDPALQPIFPTAATHTTQPVGTARTLEALAHSSGSHDVASTVSLFAPNNSGMEPASVSTAVGAPSIHVPSAMADTRTSLLATPPSHAAAGATFERMDAEVAPQMIETAPHRLAVGVHTAGLGWVEIHANGAAGRVSATLATFSMESHSALSAQLPSMRNFLAGEHVRVDHLTSERFTASSSSGNERSSGGQTHNGGARPAKTTEPRGFSGTAPAEAETESMSYISVRV